MKASVRILGIDPGSVITGYGVIDKVGQKHQYVAHGHIRVKGDNIAEKLLDISRKVSSVIEQWEPDEGAIEQVFVSKNAMSALKLGQARGAAIVAMAAHGLSVGEYAPKLVKQAVVGTGGADKEQVQFMVGRLLKVQGKLQADAADALAISICHAHLGHSVLAKLNHKARA